MKLTDWNLFVMEIQTSCSTNTLYKENKFNSLSTKSGTFCIGIISVLCDFDLDVTNNVFNMGNSV